jgi:hypothetical protein
VARDDLPQTMAMQQLQGSSDCAPITRDELVEMFGEDMPIEAVNLLRNTPGCMTIGEVRVELRKMAMQQLQGTGAGQMSELKQNQVLNFDDGLLTVKVSGHGEANGWATLSFKENQFELDADGYQVVEIPPSELRELRDFLNRIMPTEAVADADHVNKEICDSYAAENQRFHDRIKVLEKVLQKYSTHTSDCGYRYGHDCDCGLFEIRTVLAEEQDIGE